MAPAFPRLFSPIQVGRYTLRNRIVNAGHAAHFQSGDGLPTTRYVEYVRERARGGAGLVIVGHTVPHHDGDVSLALTNYDDRVIPWYRAFADAAHQHDVPILVQLGHRGRWAVDGAGFLGRPLLAPSAVPPPIFSSPQLMPHAMTTREVEDLVRKFAAAARRVRNGGMDGVEIAVGLNYLLALFLREESNQRTDRYGGRTLAERMTFLYEILGAVREALGPDRLLGVRLYDDMVEYSLGLEDLRQIAPLVEATGQVDYLNVWVGTIGEARSNRAHWGSYYYEPGQFAPLAAAIKQVVRLPVVGAGRIISPGLAERLLEQGQMDLVAMVKALIADPHLPEKAREGKLDDIRYCIGCAQSCVGHVYLGLGVGCIYNPVTGREQEWSRLTPAPRPRRVVIVGGGPAGMEAARVAGERGHRVVLFEKARRLGGQVNLIIKTPKRQSFEEIILFFERQLSKLEVDVRTAREAGMADVLAETPEVVIVATGSTPWRPSIPGADSPRVVSAREVLAGSAAVGDRVVVVDTQGRTEGCTIAEYLADLGKRVEIVTGLPYVGRDITPVVWHHLIERLLKKGVRLTPFTGVSELLDHGLEVYNVVTREPSRLVDVDTVVLAAGGQADDRLYHQLEGRVSELRLIGDGFEPRDIEMAVVEGHRAGVEV
jgi:2,4-dienoyl-CoA reductase-like NADH-dependent reductase (Old Yellow Enzyme family)/thioredoxin reductase